MEAPTSTTTQDLIHHQQRRPSYLSGCMIRPPCFPVQEEIEYSRLVKRQGGGHRWRNLLRKLAARDGGNKTSVKHLSFHYDAVSYSQNFDDGSYHYHRHHLQC